MNKQYEYWILVRNDESGFEKPYVFGTREECNQFEMSLVGGDRVVEKWKSIIPDTDGYPF